MSGAGTTTGAEVPIVWRGRRARAFVPQFLGDRDLALSPETVAHTAAAAASAGGAAAVLGPDYEALARLLLRAEGTASSYIEGVRAPVVDVVLAEQSTAGSGSPASWVAANLVAVTDAVGSGDQALTVERLCGWHCTLMAGSPLPGRYLGVVRDEQGWIGGTSPLDAALVTPPPDRLGELLDDLVEFANRRDGDPIAQTAIAHAQFEIIHPFADGNGRIGRILVAWLLVRRLSLLIPPPVSIRIAADRDGYLSGLTVFRSGQHERWIAWFADVVTGAGMAEIDLVRTVDEIKGRWRDRLTAPVGGRAIRHDALAWRVLDLLPRHLLLTSALLEHELQTTPRTASSALRQLVDAGILTEHPATGVRTRGRPPHLFISPELFALVGS
jgi:Fic family protein